MKIIETEPGEWKCERCKYEWVGKVKGKMPISCPKCKRRSDYPAKKKGIMDKLRDGISVRGKYD